MTARATWWARLALRLQGLPRTPRELDRALRLLAAHRRLGWFASGTAGASSRIGAPLPWWTYAAIVWLDAHLTGSAQRPAACLELGAGSSTLWLAQRYGTVTSLEHDERWYERLRGSLPVNVDLRLVAARDREAYLRSLAERQHWDLVVVDGLHRVEALEAAVARLGPGGLVLLDDSDRPVYAEAIRDLKTRGLTRMDFYGFSPAVCHLRCTSFFAAPDFQSRAEAPLFFGHGLATYRDL